MNIFFQMLFSYWRKGIGFLVGIPWAILIIFSLLAMASGGPQFLSESSRDGFLIWISIALVIAVALPAISTGKGNFTFENTLYFMPIATWRLVAYRMANVFLTYILVAIALFVLLSLTQLTAIKFYDHNILSLADLSMFNLKSSMALGLSLTAILLAIFWTFPESAVLVALSTAIGFSLVFVLVFGEGTGWFLYKLWLTSTIIAASYCLGVLGVGWDRRGGNIPGKSIVITLPVWHRSSKPFKSPQQAQFWFEWRQEGYALPVVTAVILIGALGVLIWNFRFERIDVKFYADYLASLILIFPYLIALGAFFAGLLIGQVNARRKPFISPFLATRPVRDAALSASMLKVTAVSLAISYFMFIAFLMAIAFWLYLTGRAETVQLGWLEIKDGTPSVFLLIMVILAWSAISLGSSLAIAGRPWLLAPILITPLLFFVLAVIVQKMLNAYELMEKIQIAFGWLLVLTIIIGVPLAYAKSLKEKHIKPWLATAALALWCAATAVSCHAAFVDGVDDHWLYYAAIAAFFALPIAAFAVAPLALAWNRHR